MVELPLARVNPEEDWEVPVRIPCKKCGGTGQETHGRGWMSCLACGSTGYLTAYMKLKDFIDVFEWRKKRDEIVGGA